MITYIDTSTLLKLIIEEEGSPAAETIWQAADAVAAVSLITVEARSALAAAHRARRLTHAQLRSAVAELKEMVDDLHIVPVTDVLVANASELAEAEALRSYDAVHLAAALLIHATVLSSADNDLCDAAARRGLHIANPLGA